MNETTTTPLPIIARRPGYQSHDADLTTVVQYLRSLLLIGTPAARDALRHNCGMLIFLQPDTFQQATILLPGLTNALKTP